MTKALKVIDSNLPAKTEQDFELLVQRDRGKVTNRRSSGKSRLVLHTSLFLIGLLSSIGCLWAMLYTSDSEEVAVNLGLHRVANSLENILSLLAYPVLMFTVILTLYALQQLYGLYKEAADPQAFRKHRSLRSVKVRSR
ncbi:hypothetical protein [Granulosicoccus antarcticus]|nr:hypothetical protein [Granulosicoccus antarcticus]